MKYRSALLASIFTIYSIGNSSAAFIPPEKTLGNSSAYNISFTPADKANADFTYYIVENNKSTPVYYKIDHSIKDNATSYGRIITNQNSANLTGNFLGLNNITTGSANGGAIYYTNGYKIGTITGDFVNNRIKGNDADGGAIYNAGYASTIGNIKGDFVNNYAEATGTNQYARGGAIYSASGRNGNVVGNFIGNNIYSENGSAIGGAISISSASIGNLTGKFINNHAKGITASGGFLSVSFSGLGIGDVDGDMIGNRAIGTNGLASGGAFYIFNSTVKSIKSNFIGNYSQGTTYSQGGAIYLSPYGEINHLDGNFIRNYAKSLESYAQGGAIYNTNYNLSIPNIKGNFISNYAQSTDGDAQGGAIYNTASFNFSGQKLILKDASTSEILDEKTFIDKYALDYITDNNTSLKFKNTTFADNKTITETANAHGGAVVNEVVHSMLANGLVYTDENSYNNTVDYYENSEYYIEEITKSGNTALDFTNVNFYNNSATSTSGEAKGGAIYSSGNLNITADDGSSTFSGNTANGKSNAIYMTNPKFIEDISIGGELETIDVTDQYNFYSTLTLSAINNGIITIDDGINGDLGYKILLTGDDTGTINLNGNIKNADLIIGDSVISHEGLIGPMANGINVINISHADILNNSNSLTLNSDIINIADLGYTNLNFHSLAFNGGSLNIKNTQVDLRAKKMGGISSNSFTDGDTIVNVENIDVKTDKIGSTNVNFTNNLIADHVVSKVSSAYGPVYSYDVDYDPATGNFIFKQSGGFNPQVETSAVAAIASASVLSDEIYSRVLADIDGLHEDRSSVVCNRGVGRAWVKTFGSDETIDLKNFSGVDSEFYGLIAGIESGRINEGKGWNAVYNAYAAYAYGEQKFAGEKVEQRGGYLGASATFYKGDFFAGATANVGTLRNKGKTVDGDDKFNSYLGGVGVKVGYNYKVLKDLILQPNIYGSYTYVNVNDYTTEKGAKVKFSDMHNIEIAPGVKLAKDFGEDARGYIKARYVFNFNEGQDATANGIDIPELEIKDYVEYGVGFEKLWANYDISAFVELMRRDGGREGWAATAGIKWNF